MLLTSRIARLAGAGSAALSLAMAAWGAFSFANFSKAVRAKDDVLETHARAVADVERLRAAIEREAARSRSYLLTGHEPFLGERRQAKGAVERAASELRDRVRTPEERAQLDAIVAALRDGEMVFLRAAGLRGQQGREGERVGALYEAEVHDARAAQDAALGSLAYLEHKLLLDAEAASTRIAQRALVALAWAASAALFLSLILGALLVRAFRRLRRHEAMLEAANGDLDAFAGRIAHDLRNVIGTLPLVAAIAREGGSGELIASRIEKVGRRAGGVIDGLLAFSRAGKPPDADAVADVAQAAAEALEDLSQLSATNRVTVVMDAPALRVACSPPLLHLVLLNLAGNAIKFVGRREVRRVRVAAHQDGRFAVLEVEDSGPGIPAPSLPRIFEPFYRAPGAPAEGTGLGLATVQRIVSAYGGHIGVESVPGKGTTVRVRLPLAAGAVAEPPHEEPLPLPPPALDEAAPPAAR